jgi:hypothetical protein
MFSFLFFPSLGSSSDSSSTTTLPTATHAGAGSRQRQRAQRDSVQCSCKTKHRADGQAEVHVSSGEESEAVTKEEDGSEDEFMTERKEPVPKPKWEVLAENKAVWEQFYKQLRLGVGSLG